MMVVVVILVMLILMLVVVVFFVEANKAGMLYQYIVSMINHSENVADVLLHHSYILFFRVPFQVLYGTELVHYFFSL
jgi:hypothetical protein